MEQSSAIVNGVRIKQKQLESIKEKNGVKMPHTVKEVTCDPPCDLDTLKKYSQMKESVGDKEQELLSQFLQDAKEKNIEPQKIYKYLNEVNYDTETGKNNYNINVSFLDKNNEKQVYSFRRGQDALEGETKFERFAIEQEKNAPQPQLTQ